MIDPISLFDPQASYPFLGLIVPLLESLKDTIISLKVDPFLWID